MATRKTKTVKLPTKTISAEKSLVKSSRTFKRDPFSRKFYFVENEEIKGRMRLRYSEVYSHEIDARNAEESNTIKWQPWTYPNPS